MKAVCLFFVISLSIPALQGQLLKGRVADFQNQPIAFASVTLLHVKDSSIVRFTQTNSQGYYELKNVNKGSYLLQSKLLGYETQTKEIDLVTESSLELNFQLKAQIFSLNGVDVKGHYTGIKYNKDTITYDPKSYTDGSERTLGDVLDKLPGVEVSESGSVKAQGKQVEKILLNGLDYYGGSTQVATKNLDAAIADSVQVISNYSEYSLLKGFQSHNKTVINVGVNKNWLDKLSGEVEASGGLENRYNLKGNLMTLGSHSLVSLLGRQNNTGETIFSMEDYIHMQGGVMGLLEKGGSFQFSEAESRMLFPMNNTYSRINRLGALNVSYQSGKKIKLNAYLLHNYNKEQAVNQNLYSYHLFGDSVFEAREQTSSRTKNKLYSGYVKAIYTPNKQSTLSYTGTFSTSPLKQLSWIDNEYLDRSLSVNQREKLTSLQTKNSLSFMQRMQDHLFIAEATIDYRRSSSDLDFTTNSFVLPLPMVPEEGLYHVLFDSYHRNLTAGLSAAFLYKLNDKNHLRATLRAQLNEQKLETEINKQEVSEEDDVLSLKVDDYSVDLQWIKNKGFFRFNIGLLGQFYSSKPDFWDKKRQSQQRVNPSLELSLHFSDKHSLTANYRQSIATHPIELFNQAMLVKGYNAYYAPSELRKLFHTERGVGFRYNFYEQFSNTMFNLTGNYVQAKHTATNNVEQTEIISVLNKTQSPKTERMELYASLDKGLGFVPWQLTFNGTYRSSTYYSYWSALESKTRVRQAVGQIRLTSKYKFPLNITLSVRVDYQHNRRSLNSNFSQTVQRYGVKPKWKINKKLYMEMEMQYVVNAFTSYANEQLYLNGSLQYACTDKLSFELRGMNMLHVHRQSWTSLHQANNYTLQSHYQQIPGHILIGAKYKF